MMNSNGVRSLSLRGACPRPTHSTKLPPLRIATRIRAAWPTHSHAATSESSSRGGTAKRDETCGLCHRVEHAARSIRVARRLSASAARDAEHRRASRPARLRGRGGGQHHLGSHASWLGADRSLRRCAGDHAGRSMRGAISGSRSAIRHSADWFCDSFRIPCPVGGVGSLRPHRFSVLVYRRCHRRLVRHTVDAARPATVGTATQAG
jgi:hypothetical protein